MQDHYLFSLLAAEAWLILAKSKSLTILFKFPHQRTAGVKKLIECGLLMEVMTAAIIFVPVSVFLAVNILRPFISRAIPVEASLLDSIVGLVSYGFPYAAIKKWAIHATVKFLREAADVVDFTVLLDNPEKERADAAGL
jgi:hypothetical protein